MQVIRVPIPKLFGQLVEYITEAKALVLDDGSVYVGIEYHKIPLQEHDLENPAVAQAVKADITLVIKEGRKMDLTLSELTAVMEKYPQVINTKTIEPGKLVDEIVTRKVIVKPIEDVEVITK